MGLVTRPTRETYWDDTTGVPADAAIAADAAYRLTVPNFDNEGCDVTPGIPVPAFYVLPEDDQRVEIGVWNKVAWDGYRWNLNTPEFELANDEHEPTDDERLGLWHYDFGIRLELSSGAFARLIKTQGNEVLAIFQIPHETWIQGSCDFPHTVAGNQVRLEVFSSVENTIIGVGNVSFWSGHFLGPVEEE